MSINKWLCKHFDDENKGYVTVGDLLNKIIYFVFCAFVAILFIGLFILSNIWLFTKIINPNADISNAYVIAVVLDTLIILGVYFHMINDLKIAKCPLKEKADEKL